MITAHREDGCASDFGPGLRAGPDSIEADRRLFAEQPMSSRMLLDTIPDVLVVLNEHRQIVFGNRALLELLGAASVEAALGKHPGEALGCRFASANPNGCGTSRFCRNGGAVAAILAGLDGIDAWMGRGPRVVRVPGSGEVGFEVVAENDRSVRGRTRGNG